ncbi:MAG TPA: glycosyltransferase [Chloroflexia bacterium]|nr:glycosyltransferase [Chloroflexia bacterium]
MVANISQHETPPIYESRQVDVSIIVPVRNAEDTVVNCLHALLRQDIDTPYKIILVDDGSTDRTVSVAAQFPQVKVLRQAQKGAAAARNAGIRAASGSIVLFTDADCEPVPHWASTLVNAIRTGADGVKGAYRTRQRSLTARFVQAEYESKYRRMAHLARIDFIDTYSAGYRRDALVEAGGFDESISAVEDQELSFRLAERGYDLRFAPEAIVYHTHADTLAKYLRKKFWIGYWKVRVVALHPGRVVNDSHTPQSLKVQMGLVSAGFLAMLLAPIATHARKILAGCTAGFLITTTPFAVSVARRDHALAAATPLMMLLRAMGLSAGFLVGLVQFGRQPAKMNTVAKRF